MTKEYKHLETKLIHAGEPDPLICGAAHAGVSPEDRRAIGISDSLIRLSVGLESTEDMIEDFDKAFGIEY